MTEVLMSTGTLPAAPPVVETMVLQASDESEAEIVGETSASDEIPKNDATAASIEQANEDSERSAPIDEIVPNETRPKEVEAPQDSSVVDQEAVADEKESNELESEVEAPQEPSVIDQQAAEEARLKADEKANLKIEEQAALTAENQEAAVADEKESNEMEPEVETPQEPSVIDQQAAEEARLNADEKANLEAEEQAALTAENIRKAEEQVATKNSSNLSFAAAFGGVPEATTSAPSTPKDTIGIKTPATAPLTVDTSGSDGSSDNAESSHSAPSAARNKRVSGLMNAYLDKVTTEPKPGDSVENWINSSVSPRARKLDYSPSHSTNYLKLLEAKSLAVPCIDGVDFKHEEETEEEVTKRRASIAAIRAKLDETAKKSPLVGFEFGEAFRQKQRFSQLSDKERAREAVIAMRGFDEVVYCGQKSATGEVDTRHIEKSFVFEGTADELRLHNGSCLVDYKSTDFRSYVFLVHRTRGLVMLQCSQKSPEAAAQYQVPGGDIEEEEFLRAAKRSAHAKFQLQIAAREGAARGLYRETGIDVRAKLERMKPAVLRLHPPVDENGVALLKNENENRLYYFLQIDDEDFVPEKANSTPLAAPEGEADSNLKLKLSSEYSTFTFAKQPKDAAELLQEHSDGQSTMALQMVMNEAAGAGVESPTQSAQGEKIVEAVKETEKDTPAGDSGIQVAGNATVYKTVGEKESATEKSVSRAMDPKILDDVDGKPKVSNQKADPSNQTAYAPDVSCGCCVVM